MATGVPADSVTGFKTQMTNVDRTARLVTALSRSEANLTAPVQTIETHISWVLLSGGYAYKIKKPLNLGFLDYSSLERRRHYCEEEVRRNQLYAPEIYLAVVPITGTIDRPRIGGTGSALEYAVQMRRFPQDALLEHQLHSLDPALIECFASDLARLHAAAAHAGFRSPYGTPEVIQAPALDNFDQLRLLLQTLPSAAPSLDALRAWTMETSERIHPLMAHRKDEGYVRECHGDLHTANLVVLAERLVAFDCIEFDPRLYWIDAISEVAFLVMDLEQRGYPALAYRFLNAYLEWSGDYVGLALLPYYLVYRALVRAKVSALRNQQTGAADAAEAQRLLDLATAYTRRPTPFLVIAHGLSGSGKTTCTAPLAAELRAIRIRADIERKRLFGHWPPPGMKIAEDKELYTAEATADTYQRLATLAEELLRDGFSVIVDATFLDAAKRRLFRRLAERSKVLYGIVAFEATPALLRANVERRRQLAHDASDADLAVLEQQLARYRPLEAEEKACALTIECGRAFDAKLIAAALTERLCRIRSDA